MKNRRKEVRGAKHGKQIKYCFYISPESLEALRMRKLETRQGVSDQIREAIALWLKR